MSPSYARPGSSRTPPYYYEAIQVKIIEAAIYTLRSNSIIATYGYIYNDSFNPCDPVLNLMSIDDQSGGAKQFQLKIALQANTTYILVVTTSFPTQTGTFSILVSDPNNVNLNYISEYI